MKRTKVVASLMMCVFCLSFLVVGVWAAVSTVNFNLSGQLTFNPEGVYVKVSGQMYRGENYGTLAPLTAANYILPEMNNYDEVDGAPAGNLPMPSWETPNVTLVPGERAVKYRIEVTNVSEAGIKGEATVNITGVGNSTLTPSSSSTAGGVTTSKYTNFTTTEYGQYIKNIQPKDTQIYEFIVELNEDIQTEVTINVSIDFNFTDDKMYQIEWEGNTYNYVNIGHYPQRYVGNTMNAELEEWYTSLTQTEKENPISTYTAYKGFTNNAGTYTQNDPVVYNAYNYIDGNTYVRIETTDVYSSNSSTARYMTGDEIENGVTAWFKVEPIQWRVLNPTKIETENAVLLSELALSANTTYYYDYTAAQNQSTSGYAGYKSSTIREFLTNSFYNEALTSEEQAKVTERTLPDSELDPSSVITADTSVTDKVWLPTYADYKNSSYGFDSSPGISFTQDKARLCSPIDFAIANYAGIYTDSSYTTPARQNGVAVYYWTSSGDASSAASSFAIDSDDTHDPHDPRVTYKHYAVRPALLFNL